MEENKSNSKNIIIAFLTVLVLGLSGFIIYDKVIDKKEESKQTENTTNNDSTNKNEFEKENSNEINSENENKNDDNDYVKVKDMMDIEIFGYWISFGDASREASYMDIGYDGSYSSGCIGMGGPSWYILESVSKLENGNYKATLVGGRTTDDAETYWIGDDSFEFKYDPIKKTITINSGTYYYIGDQEEDYDRFIKIYYNDDYTNLEELKKKLGITE